MKEILTDSYGRQIRDLRISVTDRCNFRCFYCLPNNQPTLARKEKLLSYEELAEIAGIFVSLGVEKIRLTGGEPLLRKNIERLVKKLAELKNPGLSNDDPQSKIQNPKLKDLALTTNGYLLPERAKLLKEAGLDRVTISLDSLRRENFEKITGVDALKETLEAIEAAKEAGLTPVKVNSVIVRGHNDDEIVEFARFAREHAVSFRFIEFMPLDSGHEWKREQVVSGKEIRDTIDRVFPLKLKKSSRGHETAWKYEFADGAGGEIGIIAPVTEMFCGQCSRIRLTADGQIRTCLFSTTEHNLRDVLRSGAGRAEIVEFIQAVVFRKEPRHHINEQEFIQPERTMSFIGG
jgi:cyclic pyranopterin phosphate synthase